MNNPIPILLTAAVDPRGTHGAHFTPAEREEMYIHTLQYYSRELKDIPNLILVFAESSGWNLTRIRQSIPKTFQVEFVSIPTEVFNPSRGKGYNEVLLIKETLLKTPLLDRGFLKITGRYPIYNLRHFLIEGSLALLKRNKDLYIDIKDHALYERMGLRWAGRYADVRIFASTKRFFLQEVVPELSFLDDREGRLLEGLMYNLVKPRMDQPKYVYRFLREPHFGGQEGSQIAAFSFSKEQDSFKGKMKRLTGNVLRFIAPNFLF